MQQHGHLQKTEKLCFQSTNSYKTLHIEGKKHFWGDNRIWSFSLGMQLSLPGLDFECARSTEKA